MAEAIRDFTDLIVWQKAVELGKRVYELTRGFPREEMYGLTLQIRRAAISVSSNIAEGHARQRREFSSFIGIARGSLAEVESQLLFAVAIGYLDPDTVTPLRALAAEIHKMAHVLCLRLAGRK